MDFKSMFISGIINVLTTTPLWVVNTRLKMRGLEVTPERNNNEYTTLYGRYIQYYRHILQIL